MPKEKKEKNRAKPMSLYPLEIEDVLKEILKVKPNKISKKDNNKDNLPIDKTESKR